MSEKQQQILLKKKSNFFFFIFFVCFFKLFFEIFFFFLGGNLTFVALTQCMGKWWLRVLFVNVCVFCVCACVCLDLRPPKQTNVKAWKCTQSDKSKKKTNASKMCYAGTFLVICLLCVCVCVFLYFFFAKYYFYPN